MNLLKKNFFGILLTAILALCAIQISILPFEPFTIDLITHPISAEIIAIIIGILVSNLLILPKKFDEGINFTTREILSIAIVLLGARLDISYIVKSSSTILLLNVVSVILNIIVGLWVCKKFKLEKNLTTLIVIGNTICGSSAILAIAPIIRASQNHISLSLMISSILGLIAIFIYPLIGQILQIPTDFYGIWTGATVQSVAQVLATGLAYDRLSGEVAVVVKLIKVLLLAPTIVVLVFIQRDKTKAVEEKIAKSWKHYVPPFIIGFLIMVVINSLGGFEFQISDRKLSAVFTDISGFLATMVMVGIGLKTNIKSCFNVVTKPLLSGFISAMIISTTLIILIAFLTELS